jgi:hypothetical protein
MSRLLPSLPHSTGQTHGLEAVIDAFTPADIGVTEIQAEDRPYSGYWYAGQFLLSTLDRKGVSLRAAMHLGVIGPPAGAGRLQGAIHRLTDCKPPAGWQNQIRTDIVLDYQVQLRKRLLTVGRLLEASGLAEVRVGTLYDLLRTGGILHIGSWKSGRGRLAGAGKGFRCFGSWQGHLTGVGFNATLQGGILNRRSPYTLKPNQVNRVLMEHAAAVVVGWGKVEFGFGQTWQSPEFRGGIPHRWNYLSIRIQEM